MRIVCSSTIVILLGKLCLFVCSLKLVSRMIAVVIFVFLNNMWPEELDFRIHCGVFNYAFTFFILSLRSSWALFVWAYFFSKLLLVLQQLNAASIIYVYCDQYWTHSAISDNAVYVILESSVCNFRRSDFYALNQQNMLFSVLW